MKNILFIGGTGYIGGAVLSRFLEKNDPNLNITALVRSVDKAEKLQALNMRLNIVFGSHKDAGLVEQIASAADVVFSLADSDNLKAAESILRGLKKRFETTGLKPTLLHMSGLGCLGDDAKGMFSSSTIYKDTDIAQIEALPATQLHRNVDLAIVDADMQGYINSYIVLPGIVFGTPRGILAEARVQNTTNLGFTSILSASFARRAAGFVGEGKNRMAIVDVSETADLIETLYIAASANRTAHGKHGYYFATNGDVSWEEIAEIVETRAGARRPFTQEELGTYFSGSQPSLGDVLGNNARADSERSRTLGWRPMKKSTDFLAAVRDEVEHWEI
ncbi:NmrA domain-containing protein [Mycena venus]|uniref:NmrA domain-containing protein n=1 Tax=Mycena venus TaxID=2733690 RepID=A0A8H6XZD9_9AGAR|nr:NmrA domain-containing protein [Mycena venus]